MKILILTVLLILGIFWLLKFQAEKYYEDMRDRQDFTTEWGRQIINACNEKLDVLRYFENKINKWFNR